MKWTKFKDRKPLNSTESVWITDFVDVWVGKKQGPESWSDYIETLAWAEIEYPAVPKEEKGLHACVRNHIVAHCFEIAGTLTLDVQGKKRIEVKECPFCGYSIKEKE